MLEGKVAIVTGASSGIGRATALLFAREGAAVVVNARGEEALNSLAAEIEANRGKVVAVAGDVGNEDTHKRMVDAAINQFGGLDLAFNNAGAVGP